MRSLLATLPVLLLAAACLDDAPTAVQPPPKPGPEVPLPLGVYEFEVTGIGGSQPSASVAPVPMDMPGPAGVNASLTATGDVLRIEDLAVNSVTEGGRTRGHRYVTITYRVRNSSGTVLNNVTLLPVKSVNTLAGTPFLEMLKFNGTSVDTTVMKKTVPTGQIMIGDNSEMLSPVQDVLQVFDEAEVAAIPRPVGIQDVFPYGYVVRSRLSQSNRTLPVIADMNQFDGLLSISYRIPLQPHDAGTTNGATKDAFTFKIRMLAVQDSETRLTESMEEAQDTAALRRLRARATALGATTVTVLNGSPSVDPSVADYPGQRQICSARTAGPAGAPTGTIDAPADHVGFAILRPGESMHSCGAYFRTGTPQRPATNVPFPLTIVAVDRYGHVLAAITDTMRFENVSGPSVVFGTPARLVFGTVTIPVTYTDYGTSVLRTVGKRFQGSSGPIPVAGVTRTWTAGAGTTDWHTGANWNGGAVPMSLDSVFVPDSVSLDPVLAANVSVMGVTVEAGAVISLGAFDLTAGGDVSASTNSGQGITNTTGRLILAGTARTVTGRLPRIRVTGTYSLAGNVTARAPLEVSAGRLTNATYRVQFESF